MFILYYFKFSQLFDCWGEVVDFAEKLQESSTSSTQVHCSSEVLAAIPEATKATLTIQPVSLCNVETFLVSRDNQDVSVLDLATENAQELSDAQLTADNLLKSAEINRQQQL